MELNGEGRPLRLRLSRVGAFRSEEVATWARCHLQPNPVPSSCPTPWANSWRQSVEQDIVRAPRAVYGAYTGTCFASKGETAIEHIVATSEGIDFALCAADRGDAEAVRNRSWEPDARLPGGKPPPEEVRQGRQRVAAGAETVLVRRPGARGEAQVNQGNS